MTEFKRNDPRHRTGATVEIVEVVSPNVEPGNLPVIKAHHVYVNGAPVGLIAKYGLSLDTSAEDGDATTLTLTLLPREVLVRAVAETPDGVVDGEATSIVDKLMAKPRISDETDGGNQ